MSRDFNSPKITFENSFGSFQQLSHAATPPPHQLCTPVGLVRDHFNRIWICDVGNSRIVIVDQDLERTHFEFHAIAASRSDENKKFQLLMPFHLCVHPLRNTVYLTDMGHRCVIELEYSEMFDDYVRVKRVFNDRTQFDVTQNEYSVEAIYRALQAAPAGVNSFNGITIIPDADGNEYELFVSDEFFRDHSPSIEGEFPASRIVCFSEQGEYRRQFQAVASTNNEPNHRLLWPQGLCRDEQGNLFIANTGASEIIRCQSSGLVSADGVLDNGDAEHQTQFLAMTDWETLDGDQAPGYMRSVSVCAQRVFISAGHFMSMIDLETQKKSLVVGAYPAHYLPPASLSVRESFYESAHALSLVCPYEVTAAQEENIFYVSEPFLSRIVKFKLTPANSNPSAHWIARLSGIASYGFDELFIAEPIAQWGQPGTTCQARLSRPTCATQIAARSERHSMRFRPLQFDAWNFALSAAQPWNHSFALAQSVLQKLNPIPELAGAPALEIEDFTFPKFIPTPEFTLNKTWVLDMEAWKISSYSDVKLSKPDQVFELNLPGYIGMSVFWPPHRMNNQLRTDRPVFALTNTLMGWIQLFQFDYLDKLVLMGSPIGSGQLKSSQAIHVDANGNMYVADPKAHCIWRWQLSSHGHFLPLAPIRAADACASGASDSFTPVALAFDQAHRMYVCDQAHSQIVIFDDEDKFIQRWGQAGYWDGEMESANHFALPAGICIFKDKLIVNDLVNRAIKIFRITTLTDSPQPEFICGQTFFHKTRSCGGLWMPFMLSADDDYIYVPDCSYNVMQRFRYSS